MPLFDFVCVCWVVLITEECLIVNNEQPHLYIWPSSYVHFIILDHQAAPGKTWTMESIFDLLCCNCRNYSSVSCICIFFNDLIAISTPACICSHSIIVSSSIVIGKESLFRMGETPENKQMYRLAWLTSSDCKMEVIRYNWYTDGTKLSDAKLPVLFLVCVIDFQIFAI